MDPMDRKEFDALSSLFRKHRQEALKGVYGVPRLLSSDAEYYTINFSISKESE